MLDALDDIGGFVAGFGVIVRLGYLATRIRRNTHSTKVASYQAIALVVLVTTFSIVGCLDGESREPRPSGVGAADSAILVPFLSPAFGEALFVSGDTVAVLGSGAMTGPSALHVTSLDPSFGPTAPLRSLDVSAGILGLSVSGRFLAWLRPGTGGSDPDRLRVYDTNDLGAADITDAEWTPTGATSLDVFDFDLAGSFVAWIGWVDDDRMVAPRVGVADLADGLGMNSVDFGETLGTFPEIAGSNRLILWHDDRDVYAIAAPFETAMPVIIEDAVDAGMGFRVDGGLAAWTSLGDVYVFDVDRPVVADVNPRNVGDGELLGLSDGYVLYVDFNQYYVHDVTDPSATPEFFYREARGEDHKPKLGGHFVAWSVCQNVDSLTLFTTVFFCATTDPDTTVFVLDLVTPRVPGTNPLEVATGSERLRLLDLDDLGVAWRTRGRRSELRYWNPGEPLVESVNPLAVYVGSPDPEEIDLSSSGLLFPVDVSTGVDAIRFVDAMTLLLMTNDGP